MQHSILRYGILLVVVVAVSMLAMWGCEQLFGERARRASVQNTTGVVMSAALNTATSHRAVMDCRIENQTSKIAHSVVFTVEILEESGEMVGTNPLGNVLNLQPGEIREIEFPVPLMKELPPNFQIETTVNLVRWEPL